MRIVLLVSGPNLNWFISTSAENFFVLFDWATCSSSVEFALLVFTITLNVEFTKNKLFNWQVNHRADLKLLSWRLYTKPFIMGGINSQKMIKVKMARLPTLKFQIWTNQETEVWQVFGSKQVRQFLFFFYFLRVYSTYFWWFDVCCLHG